MSRPSKLDVALATILPLVLLLTWVSSRAALTGPFVFDDYPNLRNLARVAGVFDLPHLANYLQAFIADPGRPLAALSFLIDDYAWPSTPDGFKRTNLLLHLLGGVLVFGLVRRVAGLRLEASAAAIAGLLASAAWLLHPMQLSTSMLVVQRMTQLMALVSLAAMWWATAFVQRAPLTLVRTFLLLAGLGLATIVAFLCKENGALLPLYALVLLFLPLRPALDTALPRARRLLAAGLVMPVLGVIAQIAWTTANATPDSIRDFTPGERVLTQGRVLVEYIARLALPRLDGSGLFHDDYVPSHGLMDPWTTLPALAACIALLVAATALRARAPLFAFAVFWFFGGHLIESSPLSLELYFEHRNYLPMVGPIAAVAIWLARLPSGKMRRVYWTAAMAWLAMCTAMTAVQAKVWSSEAMLATIWAAENPRSARAVELQAKVLTDRGLYDAAYENLEQAMVADPSLRRLALDLVLIDCQRGTLTPAHIDSAAEDLRRSRFNRSSLEALGMLQGQVRRGVCPTALTHQSWQQLAEAMLANPVYGTSGEVAVYLWVEVAKNALQQGDGATAEAALERAYGSSHNAELVDRAYLFAFNNGRCESARRWWSRRKASAKPGFDAWMQSIVAAEQELPLPTACTPLGRGDAGSTPPRTRP